MKSLRPRCTAIKALLFAALLAAGSAAWAAQVAGVVTRLSGPLMAKKADGSAKVLALRSEVETGDTLVTEKNTYALIKMVDNSEVTLRPATTFKIEDFAYDAGKPEADNASFSLVKGGLRSVTGLMGKRNKEKFSLKTPTATIGIRGTTFIAHYVPPGAPPAPGIASRAPAPGSNGPAGTLREGLHVQVSDGAIIVINNGGSLQFSAGQFGYVPSVTQPPVIVPPNTGLQFTPPPSFDTSSGGPTASTGSETGGVDCIVR